MGNSCRHRRVCAQQGSDSHDHTGVQDACGTCYIDPEVFAKYLEYENDRMSALVGSPVPGCPTDISPSTGRRRPNTHDWQSSEPIDPMFDHFDPNE